MGGLDIWVESRISPFPHLHEKGSRGAPVNFQVVGGPMKMYEKALEKHKGPRIIPVIP